MFKGVLRILDWYYAPLLDRSNYPSTKIIKDGWIRNGIRTRTLCLLAKDEKLSQTFCDIAWFSFVPLSTCVQVAYVCVNSWIPILYTYLSY